MISVTLAVAEMPLTCLPSPFKPFVPLGVDFARGESTSIGVEDIVRMKGGLGGMIGEKPYVNKCQASMFVQKSCSGNFEVALSERRRSWIVLCLVDSLLQG